MAQKCVHKGCGKVFTDPDEPCVYHPGPPEFHEGQKGWKCCKPRYLTFDEFLAIPPCTTGKHSTVDDTPAPPPKAQQEDGFGPPRKVEPISTTGANGGVPVNKNLSLPTTKPISSSSSTPARQRSPSPAPVPEESDSDDPDVPVAPAASSCKRRACGKSHSEDVARADEECVYHPGTPVFHEGSKGWTCCKRRVLEFDEFMKIAGCKRRKGHLYVGKRSKAKMELQQKTGELQDEKVESLRSDYYQTGTSVIVSFYLKKVDKAKAGVSWRVDGEGGSVMDLDLPTSDGKRYKGEVPLWGGVEGEKCAFKVMGTKVEVVLVKRAGDEGRGWPALRRDERGTGEIIQTGRAGRA